MARVKLFLASFLVTVAMAAGAQACSVARVAGANDLVQPGKALNQRLIDAAIRAEVNFHRCRSGLKSLSASKNLSQIAKTHANWMARSQTLSHKSRVSGQGTLKARLSTSGVRFRAGSENIGMVHRFRIDGQRFQIRNASACQFSTNSGQPIPPHSYQTLARHIVTLWMKSPGHRKNILDRRVSMVGSGLAFTSKAPHCGQFYLSQNFAG